MKFTIRDLVVLFMTIAGIITDVIGSNVPYYAFIIFYLVYLILDKSGLNDIQVYSFMKDVGGELPPDDDEKQSRLKSDVGGELPPTDDE